MLALPLQTCDSAGEGNLLITVWCLFVFLFWLVGWFFTGHKGWLAFVPLPQGNLVDMESYTAGKSQIREFSKCAAPEKQSSPWDVFRHERSYTISDVKMSPTGFRGNALVYKSDYLTHWSYFWFKLIVTAGELGPTSTVLASLRKRRTGEICSLNVRGRTSLGHEYTHQESWSWVSKWPSFTYSFSLPWLPCLSGWESDIDPFLESDVTSSKY